eukprot:scaffold10796_cov114-Isochrysis_galbana.AAC.7
MSLVKTLTACSCSSLEPTPASPLRSQEPARMLHQPRTMLHALRLRFMRTSDERTPHAYTHTHSACSASTSSHTRTPDVSSFHFDITLQMDLHTAVHRLGPCRAARPPHPLSVGTPRECGSRRRNKWRPHCRPVCRRLAHEGAPETRCAPAPRHF